MNIMERMKMAKLKSRKNKKRKSVSKDFNLLSAFGAPPIFTLDDVNDPKYDIEYAKALNWCNAGLDTKAARTELVLWLETNAFNNANVDAIKSLPDWRLTGEGNIAYLANNGWPLKETSFEFLNDGINAFLEIGKELHAERIARKKAAPAPISVALTNHIASYTLRSAIEDLVYPNLNDEKFTQDKANVLIKGHKAVVTDVTASLLQEMLNELDLIGEDEQVTEGYEHFKKKQIKQIRKDLVTAIELLKNNRLNAKAVNRGRKKKPRSATAQTLKMKFKESDSNYNIVSAKPADLIGATKATIFNTKTRKIGVYQAKDEAGFGAKGTTLLDFDEDLSSQKTLRSTKSKSILDHLTEIRKAPVRKVDKLFETLNTTPTKLTGRFNGDILILKVYK